MVHKICIQWTTQLHTEIYWLKKLDLLHHYMTQDCNGIFIWSLIYLIKHIERRNQHKNFLKSEENLLWSHSGVLHTVLICEHVFSTIICTFKHSTPKPFLLKYLFLIREYLEKSNPTLKNFVYPHQWLR